MTFCLLAPLPSEHVADALAVAERSEAVAFATGDLSKDNGGVYMRDFFTSIQEEGFMGILPVYLQVSLSGRPVTNAPFFVGQKVSLTGVLLSYADADDAGRHKQPSERPLSTLKSDGRVAGFWRVGRLKLLNKEEMEPLTSFKKASNVNGAYKSGAKIEYILRGPTLAFKK